MKTKQLFAIAAILLFFNISILKCEVRYNITELPVMADAINNYGQIAGTIGRTAGLYDSVTGNLTILGRLNDPYPSGEADGFGPYAINNKGTIVGYFFCAAERRYRAFRFLACNAF